jgi:hypothetical protein
MKPRGLYVVSAVVIGLLVFSTSAFSTQSASLMFQEQDLGTGWWQYDYTVTNTSDNGESLYMFLLNFDQTVTIQGSMLPQSWFGVVWEGTNVTTFLDARSINQAKYISAGESLNGFSFKANNQVGNLSYHAEFLNVPSINGSTSPANIHVVPEPVSSSLFVLGGVVFAGRRYWQKRRKV